MSEANQTCVCNSGWTGPSKAFLYNSFISKLVQLTLMNVLSIPQYVEALQISVLIHLEAILVVVLLDTSWVEVSISSSLFNWYKSGCVACAAGYYSPNYTTPCAACSPGTYSLSTGSTSCSLCDPGSSSVAGMSYCTSCPAGTYAPSQGSLCLSCAGIFEQLRKLIVRWICTTVPWAEFLQ